MPNRLDDLIDRLQNGSTTVEQETAARELGQLADRRAIEPLKNVLRTSAFSHVRQACAEALQVLDPPPPPPPPDPSMAIREKIKHQITAAVGRSKATTHSSSDGGDTVTHHHSTLIDGDLELEVYSGAGDLYFSHSVKAKYRGAQVFGDYTMEQYNCLLRGDWETHLARLAGEI